jgi:hypothetical protein
MTTLSVTIDDTNKLQMFLDWLRSITFVKKVEVSTSTKGNFEEVAKVLEQLPEGGITRVVSDPTEWQRQQRDEWEIDLEQF